MAELSIHYESPPAACFQGEARGSAQSHSENGVIGEFAPAFEVCETPKALRIQADVPGVLARDLSVYVVGSKMIVWGRREHPPLPKHSLFHAYERTYGTFWRTFRPAAACDLQQMHAIVRQGVLTITVLKNRVARTSVPPELSLSSRPPP